MNAARHRWQITIATCVLMTSACTAPATIEQAKEIPVDVESTATVWRAAGAAVNNLAVVWGGLTGWEEEPQPTAEGWIVSATGSTPATRMPRSPLQARSGHAAIPHGNSIYIWGGVASNGRILNDGAAFDPQTATWRKITDAPIGLESPQLITDGDHILIGAGRRDGNAHNTSLLEYSVRTDTWHKIDLGITNIVAWTLQDSMIVVVSRQSNGRDLGVHRFDRTGVPLGTAIELNTDLPIADYVDVTRERGNIVIAASSRESTSIFQVNARGTVVREITIDGTQFTPALRVGFGPVDGSVRDGDVWLSMTERRVHSLSVSQLEARNSWGLEMCRTESVWVPLSAARFVRYGGIPCGGVPAGSNIPLFLVDLSS